jgi:hypothetical protein
MRKGQTVNGFIGIHSEGGILPPEFLHTLSGLTAKFQTNAEYGLTRSFNIKDEIGRSWRITEDLWKDYREQRERQDIDAGNAKRLGVQEWLYPLFETVLGYHDIRKCGRVIIGDRQFPIGFKAAENTVPLVLTTEAFDLDQADTAFGDQGRRRTPHGMLQEYLNAEETCLWGIVSNGRKVRLLRDNPSLTRPAYIEADFDRIFEEQLFADFSAFWLIFHASRLAPRRGDPTHCIVESWHNESIETGERARENLRDGVTEALRQLGNGFLKHPENSALREAMKDGVLSDMTFFQELLRLVYRFLFLFTAEDRKLLFAPETSEEEQKLYRAGYSLSRLRDRALKRRHYDEYTDLWTGLQVTFQGLSKGASPLGLPALGGLFNHEQCPWIDNSVLENAKLLSAIRSLAFFESERVLARVNFRDMGTEELGSVYESLLELQPQVEASSWEFGFLGDEQKAQNRGSQRKLTGSYYTPPELVGELIKSALIPVIDRTLRENKPRPRQALLELNIIDPACGSGHFLLAAARYIATEIARLDAGPDAPSETLRQHALREVVQHCIYGVDRNPLAVELCKTALWIETVEPGKPLTFLDAHIRCGDSLIGVLDPAIMEEGIPDEAYKPLTGDDKKVCLELKKRNRAGREGAIQGNLFDQESFKEARTLAFKLETMPEESLEDIEAKRIAWEKAEAEAGHQQGLLKANLFVGAFFAPKTKTSIDLVPLTEDLKRVNKNLTHRLGLERTVTQLATEHRFFHWHLAFPEVFAKGGFDVVLGNPPWERIKLQEKEFFSSRSPEIANAKNTAERGRLIKALNTPGASPAKKALHALFHKAKREAEAASLYIRQGGRFPLTAFGDVNTYALFSEVFYQIRSKAGRAGIIVPSGIATDDSTKIFFEEISNKRQMMSLYDFENRERLFPSVDSRQKFCLLTLGDGAIKTRFVFFATNTSHLVDKQRSFTLSTEDIGLINPNTRTCPVFRSDVDAELTKKIYRRVPALIDETKGKDGNPWGISFMRMLDMANDSHLFKAASALADEGAHRDGVSWVSANGDVWVPLYEAKMIHHYDHRWATYEANGKETRDCVLQEKQDTGYQPLPRYWVPKNEVEERLVRLDREGNVIWRWDRGWLLGWRDITNATNERTVIAGVIPRVGVGNNMPLLFTSPAIEPQLVAVLNANLSSLVFDFFARHKIGGTHLNFFLIKQLPVLGPSAYSAIDLDFIVPRILELVYSSPDLKPFAKNLGYSGPPFKYDPDRRAVLRAELDAYFARLYGLTRDELRYILDPADVYGEDFSSETFRVLKEKEQKEFGEYRTRRLVLEAWDRLEMTEKRIAFG